MAPASSPTRLLLYEGLTFLLCPQVTEPDDASYALASHAGVRPGDSVAELGSGTGFVAVAAARTARRVVATDASPAAIGCIRRNAAINGVDGVVEVRVGDWYAPLAGERFDLILANPPQMPTPADMVYDDWIALADSGGVDGRAAIDVVVGRAAEHLRPGGRLVLVQHGFLSLDATLAQLGASGLRAGSVRSVKSSIGRLTRERLRYVASLRGTTVAGSPESYVPHLHLVVGTKE